MVAIHMFGVVIGFSVKTLSADDFSDFSGFAVKLKNSDDPISQFLQVQLSQSTKDLLSNYNGDFSSSNAFRGVLMEEINEVLQNVSIYDETRFSEIELSADIRQLAMENPKGLELVRLNLLLLSAAYPQDINEELSAVSGEVTVGLIVILRAMFRRLLRGFSTNILQTTIGTFGRTSARAVTRRFVRFVGRILFGSIMQENPDEAKGEKKQKLKKATPLRQMISLTLGLVGLCLSFWGILYVVPRETAQALIGSRGLSELEAVVLAGMPLLVYAFLHKSLGKFLGVKTAYHTEIDGLFLQAYFTGAGSFLPMTTDVEYYGDEKLHFKLASCALIGMFLAFVLCYLVGSVLGLASLNFLSSMFLIYGFVYCFPIQPLEGYIVWSRSKLLWLAIALPILIAFANFVDGAFGDIL